MDNRLENIELIDPKDHGSHHSKNDTAELRLRGETEYIPLEKADLEEGEGETSTTTPRVNPENSTQSDLFEF